MTITADTLLAVRRYPTNRRIGKVRLGDIRHIQWRSQSGGRRSRFMAQPFVFGLIPCTKIVEGSIAHTCQHGPPPHEVLVCMCQKDNPKDLAVLMAHLANRAGDVKEAMEVRESAHWLEVLEAVLAFYPLPGKLTRSKQGRGKPHRRRKKRRGKGRRGHRPKIQAKIQSKSQPKILSKSAAMRAAKLAAKTASKTASKPALKTGAKAGQHPASQSRAASRRRHPSDPTSAGDRPRSTAGSRGPQ
jgi:hypothetical protein